MKLGISTACFYGRENVESTFDILRSFGVDTIEVFLNSYSEFEKPFVQALKERMDGLRVHSIHAHGTFFEPELFADYDRLRDDAEALFHKVCYAGYVFGAKYYTFHGPFLKLKRSVNIDYARMGERLNTLCDIAESYGLQIAYENVNWAYFNTPEFFRNIKQFCPKLKATLDIKQAFFSDFDPYKYLEVMGDRLVTVHLCDLDDKGNPVMPLRGKFNFERFFRRLNDVMPEINMFLEVYSRCYADYDDLKAAYEEISATVKKVIAQ